MPVDYDEADTYAARLLIAPCRISGPVCCIRSGPLMDAP